MRVIVVDHTQYACQGSRVREKRTFINGRQPVEYTTFGTFGSGTLHLRCIVASLQAHLRSVPRRNLNDKAVKNAKTQRTAAT